MHTKGSILDKALVILFIASFVGVIASNWYHFFYAKNFDYLIEASCDPASEVCFFRDCENDPDSCPPNELSYYKSYYVNAGDFAECSNNSCSPECETGTIACTLIPCGEAEEDVCEGVR